MSSSTRHFTFVLGSGRSGGNTELLARRAAAALPAGTGTSWVDLRDHPLPDFTDERHTPGTRPAPQGNEKALLDATLSATDLVIVSPLYWYSVSSWTKKYLDYWSPWLRLREPAFRAEMAGRTLWGVTTVSDEDLSNADPLAGTLRITAEYMKMTFGGVLRGYANRPGDVTGDAPSLERADRFFA